MVVVSGEVKITAEEQNFTNQEGILPTAETAAETDQAVEKKTLDNVEKAESATGDKSKSGCKQCRPKNWISVRPCE